MSQRSTQSPRSFRVLEIVLWAAMPLIALLGFLWQIMQQFSVVGCEGICHDELIFGVIAALPWVVGASFVVAIVLAAVLLIRRRRTLWAAVTGVAVLVASLAALGIILEVGFAPMRERNELIARGEIPAVPPPPSPVGSWGAGVDGAARLEFTADGTLRGSDGCNDVTGEWTQDAEGVIAFHELEWSTLDCDSADTWLSFGRSAFVREGFLDVRNANGSTIGGLPAG